MLVVGAPVDPPKAGVGTTQARHCAGACTSAMGKISVVWRLHHRSASPAEVSTVSSSCWCGTRATTLCSTTTPTSIDNALWEKNLNAAIETMMTYLGG